MKLDDDDDDDDDVDKHKTCGTRGIDKNVQKTD